jgi:hypothetical protein
MQGFPLFLMGETSNFKPLFKTTMAEKFKYRIQQQIDKLPREITIGAIEKMLDARGISPGTFYRDRKISTKSEQSISIDRIQIYAKFFDCSIEDLLPEHKEAKVISLRTEINKKSKYKTGLS